MKNQQNDRRKSSYYPVPDLLLKDSDAKYLSLRDSILEMNLKTYQECIIPILALFNTGLCLTISGTERDIPCPSLVVEEACAFKINAMNAALEDTPIDLIVLLLNLGRPEDWSQAEAFMQGLLDQSNNPSLHSTHRHASGLLASRLSCSKADYIAFREAAILINKFCTYSDDPDGGHHRFSPLQDFFPTLRLRNEDISQRTKDLKWRPETEMDRVVPDSLIGLTF